MSSSKNNQFIRDVTYIAAVGFVVNLLLTLFKAAGAILGSSYSLGADAAHSLSDSITDVVLLVGVRIWSKPADDEHPYGHRRVESIVTTIIGLFLVAAGLGIAFSALSSIGSARTAVPTKSALWAAGLSIVFKELLYHWTRKKGKDLGSSAVVANAWHHRSDALSSIPVLVTLIITSRWPNLVYLDAVCAFLVSIFILHGAWSIMAPSLSQLMDRGASDAELQQIREIAGSTDGIMGIHGLRTRFHGSWLVVDVHITVDGTLSVSRGHDIATLLKDRLLAEGPNVGDVLIHMEPHGEPHRDRGIFDEELPGEGDTPPPAAAL
ncbi:cation diffusion facilitator family transporter [Myxococcota bacterium]|nr:cation diffusion facilitator family transporter [Myxococcota bacterium]MBU1537729.1 cation diffusion facilitator family transporter [Myxococcota bacterium]